MKDPAASDPLSCVLVADDLTGACDSAVQFSTRGLRSIVYLDVGAGITSAARVKAFSTDTRDADEDGVKAQIQRVATTVSALRSHLVFKKIDSLMRGSPGVEIAAAMQAFGCEVAIITPAFPDMGRIVRNGHLEVSEHEGWQPFDIAERLRAQSLPECVHLSHGQLAEAIEKGARYISLDVTRNQDLAWLVREALDTGRRVLWAGSGGLASALAVVLSAHSSEHGSPSLSKLPVLFCIGSDHPITAAQLAALCNARRTVEFKAETAIASDVSASLAQGCHAIVRIARHQVAGERLRDLLGSLSKNVAALALSGGDTASAVCQSLDVKEIEMRDQIVTGLPWGLLQGGPFHDLPVATKSGAFGREDALIRVTDFFTCRKI